MNQPNDKSMDKKEHIRLSLPILINGIFGNIDKNAKIQKYLNSFSS
jgi:hypothetical protein